MQPEHPRLPAPVHAAQQLAALQHAPEHAASPKAHQQSRRWNCRQTADWRLPQAAARPVQPWAARLQPAQDLVLAQGSDRALHVAALSACRGAHLLLQKAQAAQTPTVGGAIATQGRVAVHVDVA